MHDEGRIEPVFTTDEGLMVAVGCSAADVHNALTSAARVCNKGFGIWLDGVGCESYIVDKTTGVQNMLWQEDRVYVHNMNVLPNASTNFPWQAQMPYVLKQQVRGFCPARCSCLKNA